MLVGLLTFFNWRFFSFSQQISPTFFDNNKYKLPQYSYIQI